MPLAVSTGPDICPSLSLNKLDVTSEGKMEESLFTNPIEPLLALLAASSEYFSTNTLKSAPAFNSELS